MNEPRVCAKHEYQFQCYVCGHATEVPPEIQASYDRVNFWKLVVAAGTISSLVTMFLGAVHFLIPAVLFGLVGIVGSLLLRNVQEEEGIRARKERLRR